MNPQLPQKRGVHPDKSAKIITPVSVSYSNDSYYAVAFYEVTEHNSFWETFPCPIYSIQEKARERSSQSNAERGEHLKRRENAYRRKGQKDRVRSILPFLLSYY